MMKNLKKLALCLVFIGFMNCSNASDENDTFLDSQDDDSYFFAISQTVTDAEILGTTFFPVYDSENIEPGDNLLLQSLDELRDFEEQFNASIEDDFDYNFVNKNYLLFFDVGSSSCSNSIQIENWNYSGTELAISFENPATICSSDLYQYYLLIEITLAESISDAGDVGDLAITTEDHANISITLEERFSSAVLIDILENDRNFYEDSQGIFLDNLDDLEELETDSEFDFQSEVFFDFESHDYLVIPRWDSSSCYDLWELDDVSQTGDQTTLSFLNDNDECTDDLFAYFLVVELTP